MSVDVSDAAPAAITIMIQDADGGAAATADECNGWFGPRRVHQQDRSPRPPMATTVEQVTIPAGMSSKMVYYSDSRIGSTAIHHNLR